MQLYTGSLGKEIQPLPTVLQNVRGTPTRVWLCSWLRCEGPGRGCKFAPPSWRSTSALVLTLAGTQPGKVRRSRTGSANFHPRPSPSGLEQVPVGVRRCQISREKNLYIGAHQPAGKSRKFSNSKRLKKEDKHALLLEQPGKNGEMLADQIIGHYPQHHKKAKCASTLIKC